jgi:hypothetical protein
MSTKSSNHAARLVGRNHFAASHLALIGAAIAALGGLGCNTQGQARNPTFTAAAAPDPAVVVAPIACRSEYASKAGDGMQSQFNLLLKSQLNVKPVELDKEQETAVCAAMGGYGDGVKDWKARATLMAVVQGVAKNEHAQSVLVPVAKYATQCQKDQSVIKDADGRTVASVDRGTETCKEGGASLHALLFSADGSLLWKSWAGVRGGAVAPGIVGIAQASGGVPDVEKSVTALLDHVPAKFVDAGGAPAAPAAEASAKPAKEGAPADDIDAIVSSKLGDAPAECKQLARAMCDRIASVPSHAALCANYATSYHAMASTPNGASLCRAQLAAVQPHG